MNAKMKNGEDPRDTSWMITKGIPASNANIASTVFSCYNYLVSCLVDGRSDASLMWYNREAYTCLLKVMAVVKGEDFVLPKIDYTASSDEIASYLEVIFNHSNLSCGKAVQKSSMVEYFCSTVHTIRVCLIELGLCHSLESLMLVIAIIWMLKTDDEADFSKCLKGLLELKPAPFDCVIEDGKRCRSAPRVGVGFLESVFEPVADVRTEPYTDGLSLCQIYAAAFAQYHCKNYKLCLDMLLSFLKKSESFAIDIHFNLANMYNLTGCCYAKLGMKHASLIYFRKSILCEEHHIACHLKNTATIFECLCNMEAASQAVDILVSSFEFKKDCNLKKPILIFHSKDRIELSASSDLSHWGWSRTSRDTSYALFTAANTALRAGHSEKSLGYYLKLISEQSQIITLGAERSAFALPSREQILAEKQLALSSTPHPDANAAEKEHSEIVRKLKHWTSEFDKAVLRLDENQGEDALKDFVRVGKKLYHCICFALCHTKCRFNQSEPEKSTCSLKSWEPKFYGEPELTQRNYNKEAKLTVQYLNAIQGKFLLNRAIMMAYVDKEAEIFQVLQNVLEFAPQDIEIRWKLTLLLWKLGHKSEACKTWLRTRGIDYRKNGEEVRIWLAKNLQ